MEDKQGAILTRKEANERIRQNLLKYGTFFQHTGEVEMPYIAYAKFDERYLGQLGSEWQLITKDDFIRVMLHERENVADPRWIEESCIPSDAKLKPETKGVTLNNGKTVYPAESIEGIKPLEDVNFSEDYMEKLIKSYLETKGISLNQEVYMKGPMHTVGEYLANEAVANSETKLLDTEVFVYLLQADCGRIINEKIEHADKLAELMKDNENLIFQSFQRAEENIEKLRVINEKCILKQRQLEEMNKPFKGLHVHYNYSEYSLKNPVVGEEFKENTSLQGEEAYFFLVGLNRADKELAMEDTPYSQRVKFSFRYGEYDEELYVDLGELDLFNCTSIAEAMKRRCSLFANRMLYDRDERFTYIYKEKEVHNRIVTEKELVKWAKETLVKIDRVFKEFKNEEKRCLKKYPGLNRINQRQCDTKRYLCPSATKMEDIPKYWECVSVQKPETYGIDEPGLVIEMGKKLSAETIRKRNMFPFYTKEERNKLEKLKELSVLRREAADDDYGRTGAKAMELLHDLIVHDKSEYEKTANLRKMKAPFKTEHLHIKFLNFERTLNYVVGKLKLGGLTNITDTIRYIGKPLSLEEDQSLEVLEQVEKLYFKYHDYDKMKNLRYAVKGKAEFIVSPMLDRPGKGAGSGNILRYYKLCAYLNGHEDSAKFIVQAMQEDKRTKSEMIRALEAAGVKNARKEVNNLIGNQAKKRKF